MSSIPSKENLKDANLSHLSVEQLKIELQAANKEIEYLRNNNIFSSEDIDEERHRYKELFHSSPSLMAILLGENFIVNSANESILNVLGRGKEIIGMPYLEAIPELEEQGFGDLLREVYKTGNPFHATEMPATLLRNGKMKLSYFDFVYQAHRNIKGDVCGVAIIATEVKTKAELNILTRENEIKFRQLADLIPDKISNSNEDLHTFYYNKSWLDFSGLSLDDLIEHGWGELVHPDEREEVVKRLDEAKRTDTDFEMEIRCKDKYGDYIWHLCRATAVKNEAGEFQSWVGATTEIHKIKEEEKRKEDFLKMVSHELKTPVTSISGYVQLLLSMIKMDNSLSNASIPLQSSLVRIDSQVKRLIRLISEMLDLSRLEENQLVLKTSEFSLNELIEDTVQDINISNPASKIKIQHDFHCKIVADKDRIEQVLINFITNAIKYSPENKNVDVRVFEPENGKIAVSIKDYGIGISEKDIKSIFKRFYRVSGKNEETFSGFGIGLFLVNEIVQRHNGSIDVKSKKGEGSEFIFTLNTA